MSSSHKGSRVLCVDHSDAILFVRQRILESAGYDVLIASNVDHGLNIIKRSHVDVAVIDNEMPAMPGRQLARKMKQLNRKLPILMVSGSPRPMGKVSIDDFLMRSEGLGALLEAVDALLEVAV
ncbi:MAG: response regulator [Candidatus Angelobacter sp.]